MYTVLFSFNKMSVEKKNDGKISKMYGNVFTESENIRDLDQP